MRQLKFSPVDEIIADLKAGKLVIVADDPGRENEADLVGAASLITSESIAFMANHGRGLICTPITPERAKALDLSPMTPKNRRCPVDAAGAAGSATMLALLLSLSGHARAR